MSAAATPASQASRSPHSEIRDAVTGLFRSTVQWTDEDWSREEARHVEAVNAAYARRRRASGGSSLGGPEWQQIERLYLQAHDARRRGVMQGYRRLLEQVERLAESGVNGRGGAGG